MKFRWKLLLILIALASFAIALSYPIRYELAKRDNNRNMEQLAAMRQDALTADENFNQTTKPGDSPIGESPLVQTTNLPSPEVPETPVDVLDKSTDVPATPEGQEPDGTGAQEPGEPDGQEPATAPGESDGQEPDGTGAQEPGEPDTQTAPTEGPVETGEDDGATAEPAPTTEPTPTPEPTPTIDARPYEGPLAYPMKEKIELDESKILPELREIYELNRDLVGWITIPGTVIDYPVVQTENSDYYLSHDFYGEENRNGQIILDSLCDPYTPSYNLVISGHSMKNKSMFGTLVYYSSKSYWRQHQIVEFETLMDRRRYVAFAAFYSANYDEGEEGFRYNVDIQYKLDAEPWLKDIEANRLYKTGIDVQFGDEFLTLTTCNHAYHKNGRFVVVCRRVREGEEY